MSTSMSWTRRPEAATPLWPFFVQEFLRIMRGRLARLILALMIYSLIMLPFIMEKPPAELLHALASWLGPDNIQTKLILFAWIDASMNKFAVILGPVLAGGIIVDERSRGLLDVLIAKPIRAAAYFTVKLAASSAAFATFYLFGTVGALCTFPWRLKGFVVSDFLALSTVHFFAAMFAATFAGTIALFFKRKLTGLLVSVMVLGTLVGFSWLGFINPAYLTISYFNPFFQGISVIAKIQNYGAWDIIRPIIILIIFNLLMLAIGRHRAAVVLEDRQANVRPDEARRDETKVSAVPQMSLSSQLSTAQHVYTGAGRIAHGATGSFKTFLLTESLKAFRLRHLLSLIGVTLMGVILTFWLPSFPESVFRFFNRVLDLPNWPTIIVANFLAGLLSLMFWLGVADVLSIFVIPREQGYLDMLLAKPLKRREYMLARLLPIMCVLLFIGVIASMIQWASMSVSPFSYPPDAYAGAAAVTIAWAVLLVVTANLLIMRSRDTFIGLMLAFIPFMISIFPGMFYIYRPDIYAEAARNFLVFPVNLIWFADVAVTWGWVITAALLVMAMLLALLAGLIAEKQELS
jgi:ABC-type transport system involved in multi-copper enzyme maturation permease subunit